MRFMLAPLLSEATGDHGYLVGTALQLAEKLRFLARWSGMRV